MAPSTSPAASGKPASFASRLALTEGTDRILRPCRVDVAYDRGSGDRCDVRLGGSDDNPLFLVHLYRDTPAGACYSPSFHVCRDFSNRFPENKPLDSKKPGILLQVPATDLSALILLEAWPRDRLFPIDDETRMLLQLLYARVFAQTQNLQSIARWRNGEPVEKRFEDHWEYPLTGYQHVALNNIVGTEGYALFMEQGSGKTPPSIARICNEAYQLRQSGETRLYRAIVVCPKQVQLNWLSEFERFATRPGRVEILRGGKIKRLKVLMDAFRVEEDDNCEYTVIVISYDLLGNAWPDIADIKWDLAIADESHSFKDTKTNRYKNILALRDNSRQRLLLSGSPVGNSALDLFAQLEFMGKGWSGFSSFKAFKRFYGVYDQTDVNGQQGFGKLIGIQNLPFIRERLARTSFIIKKSEALPDLPKKLSDIIEVDLSKQQLEAYRRLANTLAVEVEDMLGDQTIPKQLVVTNILTQLLRLAEITSGYIRWQEVFNPVTGELVRPALIDRFDPNPKLEALVELLRGKQPENKTIIWCCFVENIRQIRGRLQEVEGIDCVTFYGKTSDKERAIAVQRFNCDPACKVFIGNPSAGGTGLNLVGYDRDNAGNSYTNADHIIYYSQNWSALQRTQSEDRAHRNTTRVPVRITDLVSPNTVDEEIRATVLGKLAHGLEVSDIREILQRVLSI